MQFAERMKKKKQINYAFVGYFNAEIQEIVVATGLQRHSSVLELYTFIVNGIKRRSLSADRAS